MKQTAVVAFVVLLMCSTVQAQSSVIRLQVVTIPVDTGLLQDLLPDFEKATGYRVDVTKGDQVYAFARQGAADLVLSHFGHTDVDDFMADDLGLWPRTVFASQSVLLGPATDPAGIRGIQNAAEAFRRIAQTKSRFVVNNAATEKYLGQILWEGAGRPDQAGWYTDSGLSDQAAILAAQRSDAYVFWGFVPFVKFKEMTNSPLETFVLDDPLLQRVMMTVIVNPEKIAGVNVAGALALQRYLSSPAAQARIRAFRYPGVSQPMFWPSSFDNIGSFLLDNSPLTTTADPAVNSIVLSPATARSGDTFTATFAGANLSAQTFFDVRFRRPGATSDEVVQNWQQNTSGSHGVPAGTPAGMWKVTAVRAHRDANDHSGSFIPVGTAVTVAP
jgi:tungstate transport system substrate-binding protein